jgi:hypothetical protein
MRHSDDINDSRRAHCHAMDLATYKQHAHHLLDQLDRGQLDAVVRLLEVMADPVARAIANAPIDDEPLTEEEEQALNEAREWLQHNKPIPHEQVLAELGITQEEIESYRAPV